MDSLGQKIYAYIRKRYILGLLLLFPIAVTYFVVAFAFNSLDGILQPFFRAIFGKNIPGASFVTLFILVFLVGALSNNRLVKKILELFEKVLQKVPLTNGIYSTSKQVSTAFSGGGKKGGFHMVCAIEYPKEDVWTIGFLTNTIDFDGTDHGFVYMPSTPVPNTGWLVAVPRKKIKVLDLTADEAMKIIVAGGLGASKSLNSLPEVDAK
ncbi:MAG: DUF502 domain-containing protein [Dehalococcoidia bacterium]|nr:DUF502 domain-containing protein [Dehalococcoidia bacterium]